MAGTSSLMSQEPRAAALRKITFTEELLTKVEQLHQLFEQNEASGVINNLVQETTATIKKIQNAINRQRVEKVAELVQKGNLEEASEKLNENYNTLELGDVDEILKQIISWAGEDSLKNAINFMDYIDEKLRAAAYIAIFDEMSSVGRTGEVEILLLQDKVLKLDGDERTLKEINVKIGVNVEMLIEKLVAEIEKLECTLSKKAIDTCGPEIFNAVIPRVVEKFMEDHDEYALFLVLYSQNVTFWSSRFHVVHATFRQLQQLDLLQTEAALHLWARAEYLMAEYPDFPQYEPTTQKLVTEPQTELAQNMILYFEILKEKIESGQLKTFIGQTRSMMSIMSKFVTWYYAGHKENARYLIAASVHAGWFVINGRMHKSIYGEMEKFCHLESFEAFQLYHAVQQQTVRKNYDALIEPSKAEIEFVRAKIPRCLVGVLWTDNRKCRVVNKYYGEPLFFNPGAGDITVYSWVPFTCKEDQLWSVSIEENTSRVLFTHSDGISTLGCMTGNGFVRACADNSVKSWMIKAVDDYYVKIFKYHGGNEKYLTANPGLCKTDFNKRFIQLTRENTTHRQLWQLEFRS